MRVGGITGAAGVLLVTGRADHDGVLHRALAAGIEGTHVENIDAVHLSENLETLETGGLLQVGRDGAGLGTGSEQVLVGLDLCITKEKSLASICSIESSAQLIPSRVVFPSRVVIRVAVGGDVVAMTPSGQTQEHGLCKNHIRVMVL